MNLPEEIKIKIYNSSNLETRIKLNKIFGWSFYTKNPLVNNIKFRESDMGYYDMKYLIFSTVNEIFHLS